MKEVLLNHGYKTSKDYGLLFELAQKYRIVCFVPYREDRENNYILKDVCQTQPYRRNDSMNVSARGVHYVEGFNWQGNTAKKDFIENCKKEKLEFILPNIEE